MRWHLGELGSSSAVIPYIGTGRAGIEPNVNVPLLCVRGVRELEEGVIEPAVFRREEIGHIHQIGRMIQNGVSGFRLEVPDSLAHAEITPTAVAHAQKILARAYTLGAVEGRLEAVNTHGALRFTVWDDVSGYSVRCRFDDSLFDEVVELHCETEVRCWSPGACGAIATAGRARSGKSRSCDHWAPGLSAAACLTWKASSRPWKVTRSITWRRFVASNPDPVYWDSCTYLDFLRGGHPNQVHMRAALKDWEAGRVTLVTSTLTITEVLYVRCLLPATWLNSSRRSDLLYLFSPSGDRKLTLVELTRPIAEAARDLCWNHGIRPKDAVHVASALAARCAVLHTHDGGLQKRSRQVGGNPILEITPPEWTWQTDMGLP